MASVARYKARHGVFLVSGHLCPTIKKKPLRTRQAYGMVVKAGRAAGLSIHPHLLRHSAATHYANQPGANLRLLQYQLGHTSLKTTERYLWDAKTAALRNYEEFSPARGLRV